MESSRERKRRSGDYAAAFFARSRGLRLARSAGLVEQPRDLPIVPIERAAPRREHAFVIPQGGAYSQFKRALRGGHVIMAWGLAAELSRVPPADALVNSTGFGQDVRVPERWLDSRSELSS